MTFSIFQRSICVFIFLLNFTHNQLIAQDPVPISTPAIVSDPEAPPTSGINDIEGTTDEERVKTIYDKLVKARGDYRFQIRRFFYGMKLHELHPLIMKIWKSSWRKKLMMLAFRMGMQQLHFCWGMNSLIIMKNMRGEVVLQETIMI
jgi:hypothetical protein